MAVTTEGIVTMELLVHELGVVELVDAIVRGQGLHWCWSERWTVQYSKANWQQGVGAQPSAQEVLKRDGWEKADHPIQVSVDQEPVVRQKQLLCGGEHLGWWSLDAVQWK